MKIIMNERIRELSKQAYEDVIQNTPSFLVTKEMFEEKFAELIVRECAGKVDWILAEGGMTQGDLIKQHFGVKE
jgi:hypothetical protein